jgi:hypothetical protein
MHELALDGEAIGVSLSRLTDACRLFEENRSLLVQPRHDVRSRVSVDSFRTFVVAIGGTEPDIPDDRARGLWLLSDELNFTALSTAFADSRAAHPSSAADMKLIRASLDEWLQPHDRGLCLLDRDVERQQQREMWPLEGEIGGLRRVSRR